jgi:hypothetical protein
MSVGPIDWHALVDEAVRRRKAEGLSQRALAALASLLSPNIPGLKAATSLHGQSVH